MTTPYETEVHLLSAIAKNPRLILDIRGSENTRDDLFKLDITKMIYNVLETFYVNKDTIPENPQEFFFYFKSTFKEANNIDMEVIEGIIENVYHPIKSNLGIEEELIFNYSVRNRIIDALITTGEIIDNAVKNDSKLYDEVSEVWHKIMMINNNHEYTGESLLRSTEVRKMRYLSGTESYDRIPTGFSILDSTLGGGVAPGEIYIVVSPTNGGKTRQLINFALNALVRRKNVLYISLEISASRIAERFDLIISRQNIKNDMEIDEEEFDFRYQGIKALARNADIRIIDYPSGTINTTKIESLIEKLKFDGFHPDILFVDYGALLKPSVRYKERWENLGQTYLDLRALAGKYNIPVWTAAQGTRGTEGKKRISKDDIGGSYGIAQLADTIITINQTKKEKKEGKFRLITEKIRTDSDGKVIPCIISGLRVRQDDDWEEDEDEDE